jgi:hypothetical protein
MAFVHWPRYAKPVVTSKPIYNYETVILKTTDSLNIEAWYVRLTLQLRELLCYFMGCLIVKAILLMKQMNSVYRLQCNAC